MKDQHTQEEREFLKDLAPVLFREKHAIPSDPPPGYFNTFAERLQKQLPDPAPQKGKIIQLINFRNLAVAASVAALIVFFVSYQNDSPKANTSLVWDEATIDAAAEYIDEQDLYGSITSAELNTVALVQGYSDQDVSDFVMDFDLDDAFFNTEY
jgi:hypothetical protein